MPTAMPDSLWDPLNMLVLVSSVSRFVMVLLEE